jgi:predicted KAP-like P-loop ATPase
MNSNIESKTINQIYNKQRSFDRPITKPEEDRLGYEEFSKRFAKIIARSNSSDSYVIALTGEWGCGKSSVLNLTEYYLTTKSNEIDLSENEIPIILHFNPWIFSGREDLIIQFFNQIHEEFESEITRSKFSAFWDQISPFIDDLVNYGLSVTDYFPEDKKIPAKIGLYSLSALKKRFPNLGKKSERRRSTLFEERIRLSKKFEEKLTRKIVIIIDDIDRLTYEEILDFFRAIKAIADFPNVIYILAYDENVIKEAISKKLCFDNFDMIEKSCAKKYLEKIIQLSIPFPPPNEIRKEKYIEERLSEIFQNTSEDYVSSEYWFYVKDSISHFLSTPRRIKRTINTIKILYPSIENEVNVDDFICIETIRQSLPNIYRAIKENPEYFIYKPRDNLLMPGVGKPEHKRFHTEWFNSIDNNDKKSAITILTNLFPDIVGSIDFHDNILTYNKSGKISSARIHTNKEIFDRYFRLEIEDYAYSINEIKILLSISFSTNDFSEMLRSYLSEKDEKLQISRAGIFLKQLKNYIDELSGKMLPDQINSIILSFFNIGDELLIKKDRHQSFLGNYGNSTVIKIISQNLLMKLDYQERIKLLKEGFNNGKSISFISLIFFKACQEFEKWKDTTEKFDPFSDDYNTFLDDALLTNEENLSELKTIFNQRLENITSINSSIDDQNYEIFKKPLIGLLFEIWEKNYGNSEKIQKYVLDFVNNERAFISAIVESSSYEEGLSIQTLQNYISITEQKKKILKIIEKRNDLSQNKRKILMSFIENDNMKNTSM